jgi:nucleoside-diphosphate kinase
MYQKPFFKGLDEFIRHGPVVAFVLEGVNAIENVRKMVGGTEPKGASPGTIRGDFAHVSYEYADRKGIGVKNIIHASANSDDAEYEISLWFTPEEIHSYKTVHDMHLFE